MISLNQTIGKYIFKSKSWNDKNLKYMKKKFEQLLKLHS